jgi:ADP-ribose pyrophosphatase
MDYELKASRVIFTGRVFKLRQDSLRYPDGRQVKLDIVEHDGAVVMLPVDSEDNIWFIRQYRHAAGREMLELPAGMLEADELPLQAAEREIREETGMSAGEFTHLGGFFLAPGYSTEYLHIYLARQLEPGPLAPDDDEVITVERIPVVEAYRMAEGGEITDAKSLASLMLARPRLLGAGSVA